MKQLDDTTRKYLWIGGFLLIGILSLTVGLFLYDKLITEMTVTYLDLKKKTVLELTAAATASSAAITMIPGDIGTPIADKLADLSGYMLIVLCAVFLEKYLVSITGFITLRWVIPIACILAIVHQFRPLPEKWHIKDITKKILGLALAITIAIPASVFISKTIENTYENSIQEAIDSAEDSAGEIQDHTASQSVWDRFISTIEGGVSSVTQKFESIMNSFIEAAAVLIVTACIIPVLVLMVLFWTVKLIFRIDAPMNMRAFADFLKKNNFHIVS